MNSIQTPMRGLLALTLLVALVQPGCATQTWSYQAEPPSAETAQAALTHLDLSVAVPPASDRRHGTHSNRLFLSHVPIVPYGWLEAPKPERQKTGHVYSLNWTFNPSLDVASAVAAELAAANIFKQVSFAPEAPESDLVLRILVEDSTSYETILTYGLGSSAGSLLWIFGAPMGWFTETFVISFSLEDKAGAEKWQKTCRREAESWAFLYSWPDVFNYPRLLKEMLLEEVIPDMRSHLQERSE